MSKAVLSGVQLLCLFGGRLFGETYCSLIVKVELTAPGPETNVAVVEDNGWKTELETSRGQARFCGLGFGPVSITVGSQGDCGEVVLKHVGLDWNHTRRISVIYDRSECTREIMPVAACGFLLRFVGPDRSPIRGVSFKLTAPYPETYAGDAYGRIMLRVFAAVGSSLSGVGSASGYSPVDVETPCTNERRERIVTLRPVTQ